MDFFGRPGSGRGNGSGAYPQARVAAMAECGTHAIFAAATGPLSTGETVLAQRLFGALGPGMLLLADRGFLGFDLWRAAAATGADLLWRIKSGAVLPVIERTQRRLVPVADRRRPRPAPHRPDHRAGDRVHLPGRPGQATVYRLITTILDPAAAPALNLAALYNQRWEIETALDELKTHQGGPGMVLRSRTPDGVEQESLRHPAGPLRHPQL